jgi:hypothetical protein
MVFVLLLSWKRQQGVVTAEGIIRSRLFQLAFRNYNATVLPPALYRKGKYDV